ncbi:MAG: NAD-dependent protein deacylase [Spirochaetaceae bacterium]
MTPNLQRAAELLRASSHTTAFTGAGISVESGIPPFRGPDGLWSTYDPSVLDLRRFHAAPKETWQIIRRIFYEFFGEAEPNTAHRVLARMEEEGLLHAVITQNIDNLHQKAGSRNVWEFHGTSRTLVCMDCGARYGVDGIDLQELPPRCECGGVLKPDFIFFGEEIPPVAYRKALEESEAAQVFLVVGTTGEIMPASLIPYDARSNGATIIEVNTEPSAFTDSITDVFLQGKGTEVFGDLQAALFPDP